MKIFGQFLWALVSSKIFLFFTAAIVGVGAGLFAKNGRITWNGNPIMVSSVIGRGEVGGTMETRDAVTPDPNTDTPVAVVETDDNNAKTGAGNYLNGLRSGAWEFFYPDGSIRSRGEYANGVRVGVWRFFFPNGSVMSEGRYDDQGRKEGLWVSYHEKGTRKSEGHYVADVRSGPWTGYPYPDYSDFYWQGQFNQNGRMDQDWKWYSNGSVRLINTYIDGRLVRRAEYNGGPMKAPQAASNFDS